MAIMLSKHEFITPFIDKVKNNLKFYFKKYHNLKNIDINSCSNYNIHISY